MGYEGKSVVIESGCLVVNMQKGEHDGVPLWLYYGVDFAHEAYGVFQGEDDFAVVDYVGETELFPCAVLEPFACGLVAADVEVPHFLSDVAEVLCGVDVYVAVAVCDGFDRVGVADGVCDAELP